MQKPVPFSPDGGCWTTNEGEREWEGVVGEVLWGNFEQEQTITLVSQETLTSPCITPHMHTLLCAVKASFQSRQGRSEAQSDGCLFFCLSVQYAPLLRRLDEVWARQKKKGPSLHCCAKCTLARAFCCCCCCLALGLGGGCRVESPRGFLFKVDAAGCWGVMGFKVWERPAWDWFIRNPIELSEDVRSSLAYARLTSRNSAKFGKQLL